MRRSRDTILQALQVAGLASRRSSSSPARRSYRRLVRFSERALGLDEVVERHDAHEVGERLQMPTPAAR
jgi:hypothetical protein